MPKKFIEVKALIEMKVGKAAGPFEVSAEMIAVRKIGIGVMVELCWMEEECQMIGC